MKTEVWTKSKTHTRVQNLFPIYYLMIYPFLKKRGVLLFRERGRGRNCSHRHNTFHLRGGEKREGEKTTQSCFSIKERLADKVPVWPASPVIRTQLASGRRGGEGCVTWGQGGCGEARGRGGGGILWLFSEQHKEQEQHSPQPILHWSTQSMANPIIRNGAWRSGTLCKAYPWEGVKSTFTILFH